MLRNKYITGLVMLSSIIAQPFNDLETWNHFHTVYGSELDLAVHSPSSLLESTRSTNHNLQTLDASTNSPMIGCSSYITGQSIAAKGRESIKVIPDAIFRPFLVDKVNDKMCFAVSYPTTSIPSEITSELDFMYTVPSPLKIHSSIYQYIDDTTNTQPIPTDLSVTILMNTTSSNNNILLGNVDVIARTVSDLSTYSLSPIDNFYWTSSSTQDYYNTKASLSNDESLDHTKSNNWKQLADHLFTTIQTINPTTTSSSDPCGFKTASIQRKSNGIVMSLKNLESLDEKLRKSCLVYISASLTTHPQTFHVSLTKQPQLFNYRVRSIIETSCVGSDGEFIPYSELGLTGAGQIIGIADTGVDVQSCYFYDPNGAVTPSDSASPILDLTKRKVVQYAYFAGSGDGLDVPSGHGTHVSGIAVGSIPNVDITSDSQGMYSGVAIDAQLAFMDLSTGDGGLGIPWAERLYGCSKSAGAKVHSNSWGTYHGYANSYQGSDVDAYLYENMDMTVFFAAGNFGGDGANSVSVDSQAKNIISVGSSETTYGSNDINFVSFFSSQGPSFDGRIKPEIVSPGEQVMSAMSNGGNGQTCQLLEDMGTSMASPGAAGAALLVRQYFEDSTNTFWTNYCQSSYSFCHSFIPSGVLVKAIIIHSGSQMSTFDGNNGGKSNFNLVSPPDNTQGYGRVSLRNVLPLIQQTNFDLYVDDLRSINENSVNNYYATIADSNPDLIVTLSWYDPPGIDGTTGSVLLQDLDLTITGPDGSITYSNGGSSLDNLNNNEKIDIYGPLIGTYQISVSSNALPVAGSQLYSLVITCGGTITS